MTTQAPRQPVGNTRPVVQRVRFRFAKRGRLRFTSHRDIQRAVERAVRRAGLPIAFSAGFTPHPKISWAGAVPTGAASEAEYVEMGFAEPVDPEQMRQRLDAALPPGLDVLAASSDTAVALADALQASHWVVDLPGVTVDDLAAAVSALLGRATAVVQRRTKSGMRDLDVRGWIELLAAEESPAGGARLNLVVRAAVPVVRPEDVLAALQVSGLPTPPVPPVATRLAHGTWDGEAVAQLF